MQSPADWKWPWWPVFEWRDRILGKSVREFSRAMTSELGFEASVGVYQKSKGILGSANNLFKGTEVKAAWRTVEASARLEHKAYRIGMLGNGTR